MKNKYLGVLLLLINCTHPQSEETFLSNGRKVNSEDLKTVNLQTVLPMHIENGVRYVWIEVNDKPLRFIFDTGASNICISKKEAKVLYDMGLISDSDFVSLEYFQDATGSISEGMLINLKTVKIGNIQLNNVKALIVDSDNAPLLLGQSALEQFAKITIDNESQSIILY